MTKSVSVRTVNRGEKYIKKRIITAGSWIGIFMATVVIAFAATKLFYTQSETSNFSKKTFFQFCLNTGMNSGEIGPGDSFSVHPVITNDATEEMYVFMEFQMPVTEDGVLYLFEVEEGWNMIRENDGTVVYAYGNDEMTVLTPGEETTALTEQMTMRAITNAEYASIEDINITITGYAIGIEDVPTNPEEAWLICKAIEENQ